MTEPLKKGRDHLTVSGVFRSDKYWWCADGFVPLKITDKSAWPILRLYAEVRRKIDAEFADDLNEALDNVGAPK